MLHLTRCSARRKSSCVHSRLPPRRSKTCRLSAASSLPFSSLLDAVIRSYALQALLSAPCDWHARALASRAQFLVFSLFWLMLIQSDQLLLSVPSHFNLSFPARMLILRHSLTLGGFGSRSATLPPRVLYIHRQCSSFSLVSMSRRRLLAPCTLTRGFILTNAVVCSSTNLRWSSIT